jgi:hypothetical protein
MIVDGIVDRAGILEPPARSEASGVASGGGIDNRGTIVPGAAYSDQLSEVKQGRIKKFSLPPKGSGTAEADREGCEGSGATVEVEDMWDDALSAGCIE